MHVRKKYTSKTVLEAAEERLEYIFKHFDGVYFAFSGGKDSSVTVQLGARVARKLKKKFSVMYVDLEAMYQETVRNVAEIRDSIQDVCDHFYWICLPLVEDNALSTLNPEFITWDAEVKDKWVRDIPEGAISVQNNPFPFYEGLIGTDDFFADFGKWFSEKHERTAAVIGIRTDESIRRFVAIVSEGKPTFRDKKWTTQITPKLYMAYPIYDWRTEDIWGATAQLDLCYNRVYEYMWKNGVPLSKQRICQPFGAAQKAGLDQFRAIEPETWERLLQRVDGVNFGAIYCRTSLLGNIKSMKPKHMNWQQYAVFLLESIGIYEPSIMARYYRKIKYYLRWEEKNNGYVYPDVPEDTKEKGQGSWKNIARGLEKNDFFLTYLSFGIDKSGDEMLVELSKKHRLLGEGLRPKVASKLAAFEIKP